MNRTPSLMSVLLMGGLLIGTFTADLLVPLGYAVWTLHLFAIGAALLQDDERAPLVVALLATVLIAIGFAVSPGGIPERISIVNRIAGAVAFWAMAGAVYQVIVARNRTSESMWLQEARSRVAHVLLGDLGSEAVARNATTELAHLLGADVGALYRLDAETLVLAGGHALDVAQVPERIALREGIAGQVAADATARVLEKVSPGHLPVRTALGRSDPARVVVAPVLADGSVAGAVELASLDAALDAQRVIRVLDAVGETIGVALRSAHYREQLVALLEETQRQSEELQVQQEELRVSNEELEEQSRVLEQSQARLETQQGELEHSNVLLAEQAQRLERQKAELLDAQRALLENAARLEAANRYKSEFLANMSHELRTPLNSALILARLLAENKDGNLSAEQVKYAKAIHASNNDLLSLINDVLDLAKIEAGHIELHVGTVEMPVLCERVRATFEPLALQKGLELRIESDADVPVALNSDSLRIAQVVKNLMANAVKFTDKGYVHLRVRMLPGERIAFEVRDTGVGIASQDLDLIFEAFRQAETGASRRFGGTGLGLSISRELARRLGGDVLVESEPGRGSTFTFVMPLRLPDEASPRRAREAAPATPLPAASPAAAASATALAVPAPVPAPADEIAPVRTHERLILCVEDDASFAQILVDLAHEQDFDCAVARNAAEALRLARTMQPDGILLDIGLPDQSGLSVLERLKRDPVTRHIPVHVVSLHERTRTARELGAVGFLRKPADREQLADVFRQIERRLQCPVRRLLIVEDDAQLRESLEVLLGGEKIEIVSVGRIADALRELQGSTFDCMVMDLTLPDGTGYDLLERIGARDESTFPPIIVYTGRALDREDEERLRRYSKSIIVKGARSPERLLDEVTLFLHRVESTLPADQQKLLRQARRRDAVLEGRKILLAEDDVRTIFALSSVFEPLGVKLEIARNGREALEKLDANPEVSLALMDIMMPEMDGLTAIRRIRERPEWASLPVIALTAKAMADDREQCLTAGASDYVAKPIDVDKLVSLCRVWMPK